MENAPGARPISSGSYRRGERIGKWEFYDGMGKLEQKYDFDKKELLFTTKEPPSYRFSVTMSETTPPDSVRMDPPLFIGGSYQYTRSLQREVMYPDMERENDIGGRVVISFLVAADGTTSDYRVSKAVSPGLDKEALRVVKMLNT